MNMHAILLDIPMVLESDRLFMRPYKIGDGQWLHLKFRENEDHLAEAIEGVMTNFGLDLKERTDAEVFVRRLTSDWIMRQRFIFGLWEKTTGRYVGQVWIENRSWETATHEIGYYLVKDHMGKGFATEATKAGIAFIFNKLNARKVGLTCDEDNVRSYQVAERCGFIREGCLRDEIKRTDGPRVSKLIYGLLKSEIEKG